MPYVERIYKGKPTGERDYTPESARKRLQRENTEKAAARLRLLIKEDYDGNDLKVDITYEKTGRSLLMEKK